jgi:hypothetical protein
MKLLPLFALLLAGCVTMPTDQSLESNRQAKITLMQGQGKVRGQFVESVRAGKVRIGMNYMEAFLAWGKPDDINRTTSRSGVREQCVYGGFRNGSYTSMSFLYFENGVLTTIQN